jgi:hypothetical protein
LCVGKYNGDAAFVRWEIYELNFTTECTLPTKEVFDFFVTKSANVQP